MLRKLLILSSLAALSLSLSACQSTGHSLFGPDDQTKCQTEITTAYNEIHNPIHKTDATSWLWVKAANLVSSAQVQQSAHNYKACIQNAQRAQQLLATRTTQAH